jgi:hypothetical protein
MTWGIPTSAFLQLHVVLSLVGIVTGFIAVLGMVRGRYLPFWTAAFLLTTCLTGLTGFPLPPFGLDPPRIVGIILISALAGAATCLYGISLAGASRSAYVICTVLSLYLNVFVAVVQSFQKIGLLQALAPTQREPPFVIAQVTILTLFIVLGFYAWRHFHSPFISPTHGVVPQD